MNPIPPTIYPDGFFSPLKTTNLTVEGDLNMLGNIVADDITLSANNSIIQKIGDLSATFYKPYTYDLRTKFSDGTTHSGTNYSMIMGNATSLNNQGGSFSMASGTGYGAGAGGSISLIAQIGGATGSGGDITLDAGWGGSTSGNGGNVFINSGSALGNGNGGDITLLARQGSGGTDGKLQFSVNGLNFIWPTNAPSPGDSLKVLSVGSNVVLHWAP